MAVINGNHRNGLGFASTTTSSGRGTSAVSIADMWNALDTGSIATPTINTSTSTLTDDIWSTLRTSLNISIPRINQYIETSNRITQDTQNNLRRSITASGIDPSLFRVDPTTSPGYTYRPRNAYIRPSRSCNRHATLKKSARYAYSLLQGVVYDFDNLHRIFSAARLTGNGTAAMNINVQGNLAYINLYHIPSIVLERRGSGIFLHSILTSPTNQTEKLKRLILRHLGFNCVRYANTLKLTFDDGSFIRLKRGEPAVLTDSSSTQRNLLIGRIHG